MNDATAEYEYAHEYAGRGSGPAAVNRAGRRQPSRQSDLRLGVGNHPALVHRVLAPGDTVEDPLRDQDEVTVFPAGVRGLSSEFCDAFGSHEVRLKRRPASAQAADRARGRGVRVLVVGRNADPGMSMTRPSPPRRHREEADEMMPTKRSAGDPVVGGDATAE